MWTPWGPPKVSRLQRCPDFPGLRYVYEKCVTVQFVQVSWIAGFIAIRSSECLHLHEWLPSAILIKTSTNVIICIQLAVITVHFITVGHASSPQQCVKFQCDGSSICGKLHLWPESGLLCHWVQREHNTGGELYHNHQKWHSQPHWSSDPFRYGTVLYKMDTYLC